MSTLTELIQELCPDGVSFTDLINVCEISKGTQFNKADMADVGSYPVINGGINPSGYVEQYNQSENTITISQGGASAGYVNWIPTRFWAGAHCYVLIPKDSVDSRFLYHFVKSAESKLQECQYGAGIPALAKNTIEALTIPLPPFPIQREVARILDKLMERTAALTAALTAELTARKKQYEYYRDQLLNHPMAKKMPFGEIFDFKNGFAFKSPLFKPAGNPILRIANIQENRISMDDLVYFEEDDYKEDLSSYIVDPGDIVIAMSGATTGKIGINDQSQTFYLNQRVGKFIPRKDVVLQKYLYYILLQKTNELYSISGGGAQPNLSSEKMKKVIASIPSLEVQAQAVSILDRFDVLCNDLTSGLSAEIAARQKQYEYYREKLLSFPQKV